MCMGRWCGRCWRKEKDASGSFHQPKGTVPYPSLSSRRRPFPYCTSPPRVFSLGRWRKRSTSRKDSAARLQGRHRLTMQGRLLRSNVRLAISRAGLEKLTASDRGSRDPARQPDSLDERHVRNGECGQADKDQLNDRPIDGRATKEVTGRSRCHQNAEHG